jgi:hypothetical protein
MQSLGNGEGIGGDCTLGKNNKLLAMADLYSPKNILAPNKYNRVQRWKGHLQHDIGSEKRVQEIRQVSHKI